MLGEGAKKLRANKWPIIILELQDSLDRQEFICVLSNMQLEEIL